MTIALPVMEEFHTSDVGDTCPYRVALKKKGQYERLATSALVRGLWAHEALQMPFQLGMWSQWSDDLVPQIIDDSQTMTLQGLEAEGRPVSEGAKNALDSHRKDVTEVLLEFGHRFSAKMAKCELVGCEVPMRWTMPARSRMTEPASLASHVDIVLRDPKNVFGHGKGSLILLELKYKDREALTAAWIHRHPQITMYLAMMRYGSAKLPDWIDKDTGEVHDGTWWWPNEWPHMYIVDLPMLKAYKRAGTYKVPGTGEQIAYKKGDTRPDHMIFRKVSRNGDRTDTMLDRLADHIEMFRQGFFPALPTPTGCLVCDCENYCDRNDM